MASVSLEGAARPHIGTALLACVASQGSAAHPYFGSETLLRGPDAARNLADAIHFLCALHGRQPGIVELAAAQTADPAARAWLAAAAEAMGSERSFLARLAAAAGPIPGTPDGGASETAVQAQRNAVATLARSERRGCALGAALAFAADWSPVRTVLDFAAKRLGLDAPKAGLGDPDRLGELAAEAAQSAAMERALMFGAQQVALQHHGLWDLLEARQQARAAI